MQYCEECKIKTNERGIDMNKILLLISVCCLVVPFILSLKADRPREYRRWGLAFGFWAMCSMVLMFPKDGETSNAEGENIGGGGNSVVQEYEEQRVPATWCAAEELDLSGYSVVDYAEVAASNYLATARSSYPVQNAFDGNPATCWQDGVEGNGEGTELSVILSESCDLQYIVFYNGQSSSEERFRKNGRVCQLEIGNGQFTEVIELADENIPVAIQLDGWENVSSVYFKINSVYPGSTYMDTCISEIVFYR